MIDNAEMVRVNKIFNNNIYRNSYQLIKDYEKTRIFCKHDMAHFLDVARIAWIFNLEENLGISREIIYAAAILHDIGKYEQYINDIPHESASVLIAHDVLKDCGFDDSEIQMILSAIETHRDEKQMIHKHLNRILYRADKMSRSCFTCDAKSSCNWDLRKMNMNIKY